MSAYACLMVLCYPLGISSILFVWLYSFRKRLDPQSVRGRMTEADAISQRGHDEVLKAAPITVLSLTCEFGLKPKGLLRVY